MSKAINTRGRTIGSLVAQSFKRRRDDQGHNVWRWRCTCGRIVDSSIERIRQLFLSGQDVCCRKCQKEKS